jgi:hypothetical protein
MTMQDSRRYVMLRKELLASRKRLVVGTSGRLTMAHFDIVLASASALLVNRPCGSPMTHLFPVFVHNESGN